VYQLLDQLEEKDQLKVQQQVGAQQWLDVKQNGKCSNNG